MLTIEKLESQTQSPQIVENCMAMKPEKIEFSGSNLRMVRKKRNFSREDLADLSGCSASSIKGYELGKIKPTSDVLSWLGDALSVRWEIPPQKKTLPESRE